MLSPLTKRQIGKFITLVADSEIHIEVLKQILIEQENFDPYNLFCALDEYRKGYLSINDLEKFLEDHEVHLKKSLLFEIFRQFDTNENGKISQIELLILKQLLIDLINKFCLKHAISHTSEKLLNLRKKKSPKVFSLFVFLFIIHQEIQWALTRVLQELANNIQQISLQRDQLLQYPDFSLQNCFTYLMSYGNNEINYHTIKTFVMENSGINLCIEQLNAFFRVTNFLHTNNLNYQNFVSLFFPYGKSKPMQQQYQPTTQFIQPQWSHITHHTKQRTSSLPRLEPVQMIYSPPKRLDWSVYENVEVKYSDLYDNLIEQRFRSQSGTKKQVQFSDVKTKSTNYSTPLKESLKHAQLLSSAKNSKQSPLKQTEESQLIRILKEQIILERELEESRKQLIFKNDFNLLDGFRIIDQIGKGFVTSNEFKQSLENINIYATDEQIYLFFRRYDRDQDGLLRYSDFCRFCIPLNKQFAKILNDRPPFYQTIQKTFTQQTTKLIAELFNKGLATELAAEGLRKAQNRKRYFNLGEAFAALDKHENGFITFNEFKEMFDDYGIYASKEDLIALIKRYDSNLDGKVSYSEFINEMTQKTPTKI